MEKESWQQFDESDPKFNESFLVYLGITLQQKKFGERFIEEYYEHLSGKMADAIQSDDIEGMKESFNMIPELERFQDRIKQLTTLEALKSFAEQEGLKLTPHDIEDAKKLAIEEMISKS